MNENLFITSVVIISAVIIYLVKKYIIDKLNIKMIKYEQHVEVLEDLQWEYDRKLAAYRIFMLSAFLTFSFMSVSVMLIINAQELIWFHILTIVITLTSLHYNYLNRDALLNKIDVKAYNG